MKSPPVLEPRKRRERFEPLVRELAKHYAASDAELCARFVAAGLEEIEPAHNDWGRRKQPRPFDLFLTHRARSAMLRRLHEQPLHFERDPGVLDRLMRKELDGYLRSRMGTIVDSTARAALTAACRQELHDAFRTWNGRGDDFATTLPRRFDTVVARILHAGLADQESIFGEQQVTALHWLTYEIADSLARKLEPWGVPADQLFGVAQEHLCRAFSKWDAQRAFRPWAGRVARNAMIDFIRKDQDALSRVVDVPPFELDGLTDGDGGSVVWVAFSPKAVLDAFEAALEWMRDSQTISNGAASTARGVFEAWRDDSARKISDKLADPHSKFPRQEKHRTRELVEASLRRVYDSVDCPGAGESLVSILRRLFGSLKTERISGRQIEQLERARLLLQQQKREGRCHSPEWALTLVAAVLQLVDAMKEDL